MSCLVRKSTRRLVSFASPTRGQLQGLCAVCTSQPSPRLWLCKQVLSGCLGAHLGNGAPAAGRLRPAGPADSRQPGAHRTTRRKTEGKRGWRRTGRVPLARAEGSPAVPNARVGTSVPLSPMYFEFLMFPGGRTLPRPLARKLREEQWAQGSCAPGLDPRGRRAAGRASSQCLRARPSLQGVQRPHWERGELLSGTKKAPRVCESVMARRCTKPCPCSVMIP